MRIIKFECPMRGQRPEEYKEGHFPYKQLPALMASWRACANDLIKLCGYEHVVFAVRHYSKSGTLIKVDFMLRPMNGDELDAFARENNGCVIGTVHKR